MNVDYCLVTRACISVPYLFARVIESAFFSYLPRNTTAAWQKGLRGTITICSEARLYKRRVPFVKPRPGSHDKSVRVREPVESASPLQRLYRGRIIGDDKLARRSKGFAFWFTADRAVRGACQGDIVVVSSHESMVSRGCASVLGRRSTPIMRNAALGAPRWREKRRSGVKEEGCPADFRLSHRGFATAGDAGRAWVTKDRRVIFSTSPMMLWQPLNINEKFLSVSSFRVSLLGETRATHVAG